jgi:L-Ala-D/L-Glu epimerase
MIRNRDVPLQTYTAPLPLCADESCLDSSEVLAAASRYQMINIKLD